MTRYVALLRGVNVGGNNKLPMAALASSLTGAGLVGVRTYIQSGNVVFDARRASAESVAARVRTVIAADFGLDIPTLVVDAPTLAAIVRACPYADEPDPRRVHVFFLPADLDDPSRARLDVLVRASADSGSRDSLTVGSRVIYLHTPDGFGSSDLAKALSSKGSGVHRSGTARNWSTVTTLLDLALS